MKISIRFSVIAVVILICSIAGLLVGPRLLTIQAQSSVKKAIVHTPSAPAIVTIPKDRDLFEPFILTVQPGEIITWENEDSRPHSLFTTPDFSNFLNPKGLALYVAAGQRVSLSLFVPGIYHYYDAGLDSWSKTFSRVVAGQHDKSFPMAMEGIIWVQGNIPQLPSNAMNFVLNGHDDFASEFIAIHAPGAVTWHNLDADPHFVGLVAGWSAPVNPVDIGLYRIGGTDEVIGGESITVLFNTPGLYYYYCRNHGQVDPLTHRVHALEMASEYPIPMEGFILVV